MRDQYVMQVADRLRVDVTTLRTRVSELAKNPRQRSERNERGDRGEREIPNEPAMDRPRSRTTLPRPGLEALRLYLHGPEAMKERLIAPYFVNEVQREIFEGLTTSQSLSELVDAFERRGQDEAAQTLSELVVDELDHPYSASDLAAVIAQLLRSAIKEELARLDRDMREGRVTPEVARVTSRDVKEREQLLESNQGDAAERDLRQWLLERASLPSS